MDPRHAMFPLLTLLTALVVAGCPTPADDDDDDDTAELGGCPELCHELMDGLIEVWDDLVGEGDPLEIVEPYRGECDDAPAVGICAQCATYIDDHIPYVDEWEIMPDLLDYYGPTGGDFLDADQIAGVQETCEDHGLEF